MSIIPKASPFGSIPVSPSSNLYTGIPFVQRFLFRSNTQSTSAVNPSSQPKLCTSTQQLILQQYQIQKFLRSHCKKFFITCTISGSHSFLHQTSLLCQCLADNIYQIVFKIIVTFKVIGYGNHQAGSFYQPCIVICDPNTLETLPEEQYRCGCAEIIKYSMLGNAAFFEELYKTPVREQYEHVIEVCVQMKRDIVGADEYDLGRRRTLNLGHTFGHAVEQCSDFSLLHGEAVAIGMATVTRAAVKRGICGEETLARLLDILHRYGLPTETGYELDKLYEAELVDKKISGGKMHLIVPEKIGQVRMETIPVEALRDWMQDGGIR